ncbi:MAG: PEP-CTERM sorting domain-containing protein [Pirellulales bacterium]|nr:PEP-CTERM sorting domain-containing protein [Pirellulales bacterium]
MRCCATLGCVLFLSISNPALADEPMSTQSGPCVAETYFEPESSSGAVVLSGVPAYDWYHGCGPTAAGSIIGYYDYHGFDDLFDASGWAQVKYTRYVRDQISSPAHNAKYDPKPDDPNLPVPPNTSIACWFRTSVGGLDYGWSSLTYSDDALEGYATYRGYECNSWWESYSSGSFTWNDLKAEIAAGRPMMFLVDTNGDGSTDHFVPVFGYESRVDGNFYACYDTWSENESVRWEKFQGGGNPWGVMYGTFFSITDHLAPGDANGDGHVNASDASVLAKHWLMTDQPAWGNGDFNNDGQVNDLDASILAAHWGTGPAETSSPVPEPSMGILMLLATATLSLKRLRKAS